VNKGEHKDKNVQELNSQSVAKPIQKGSNSKKVREENPCNKQSTLSVESLKIVTNPVTTELTSKIDIKYTT